MALPISVIIPCYKQEQWLNRAIESAVNQADDITIVYDNSEGGYWGDSYNNVGIFRVGYSFRAGVCYARNAGIDATVNNLILPLDADDRLYPDALERMYTAWSPNTFVYGRYTEIDEQENVIREMDAPPPELIFRKNLTFSTFLFDKLDWQRVGGYDCDFECLEEDYAMQCALVNAGVKPIRLEGAPLYKRMIHTNSRTAKAMRYWNVTLQMCKERYPNVFKVGG